MQEPAALDRARALIEHARYLRAPLHQFCVTVSRDEGFELIEWFQENADPKFIDLSELSKAATEARDANDPFLVLQHFRLLGLEMIAKESLQ